MLSFRKAEKRKAKLRLAITGTAGSGKTYGALLVAFGLGGRVAMIDTENGSGDLYSELGDYDICSISAPFSVNKYIEAIKTAEAANYDILIIDSLSHAWAGEGGLLDMQGRIAETGKKNNYTAWREVTPLQNKLIDTLLMSQCHIIATLRSKTEYAQIENEQGRKEIRKVGLAPIQRDGIEYEFCTVFDLNINHIVNVSKDRTSLFDGQIFKLSQDTGQVLREWLESGADYEEIERQKKNIYFSFIEKYAGNVDEARAKILQITEGRAFQDWTESDIINLQAKI